MKKGRSLKQSLGLLCGLIAAACAVLYSITLVYVLETAENKLMASLMDDMLQEGDVHENERPVQHSVVFQTAEDMDSFKNEVINKGFVITRGDEDLELIVLHITPIDDVKLMGNILYIAGEAKLHHGKYQGWSSKVIY